MREISLYLLLGHLFIAGVGSACIPVVCLKCSDAGKTVADTCPNCSSSTCIDANTTAICKKAFQVSVKSNRSEFEEGDSITLICDHDLPDVTLTIGWKKDEKELPEYKNISKLIIQKALAHHTGLYACYVNSSCGIYNSLPSKIHVRNDSVLILVICGVSALALILLMGLAMKIKLKRDNAKHRERREQRAQHANRNPPAFVPRES